MGIKRRIDKIEDAVSIGKLPPDKRQFLVWDNGDGLAEEQVEKRKAELLEEFGTTEGFNPLILRWQDENQREPIAKGPKEETGCRG